MQIEAKTIAHDEQPYQTSGNWEFYGIGPVEKLTVTVSEMPDERYEQLVAVHEIIEALLCKQHGIAEERVSEFDKLYEDARPQNLENNSWDAATSALRIEFSCNCEITDESEPGDDPHSPYYHEHQIATGVERILAAELGVDWNAYEQANLELYNEKTA